MWEFDCEESWAPKNWCFWTVMLEKNLESPLGSKEIKPVKPKIKHSWIFIGRTDAEAPILWPPDGKNWLIGKDPDAGKDWGQEEKGMTEDEMAGWHHGLNRHEFEQFEQAPGVGDGLESMGSQRVGHNWVTELNYVQKLEIERKSYNYHRARFWAGIQMADWWTDDGRRSLLETAHSHRWSGTYPIHSLQGAQ